MATANTAQQLALEIEKIQNELTEKQKKLAQIQQSEIEKLVTSFMAEIEKSAFDKVTVKKMIIEKLTRKHKPRK